MGFSEMELQEIEARLGEVQTKGYFMLHDAPRLISALREARADVERMAWLSDPFNYAEPCITLEGTTWKAGDYYGTFGYDTRDHATLREAIDKARSVRARAAVDGRDEK